MGRPRNASAFAVEKSGQVAELACCSEHLIKILVSACLCHTWRKAGIGAFRNRVVNKQVGIANALQQSSTDIRMNQVSSWRVCIVISLLKESSALLPVNANMQRLSDIETKRLHTSRGSREDCWIEWWKAFYRCWDQPVLSEFMWFNEASVIDVLWPTLRYVQCAFTYYETNKLPAVLFSSYNYGVQICILLYDVILHVSQKCLYSMTVAAYSLRYTTTFG